MSLHHKCTINSRNLYISSIVGNSHIVDARHGLIYGVSLAKLSLATSHNLAG